MRKNCPPAGGENILAVAEGGDQNANGRDSPEQTDQDQNAIDNEIGNPFLVGLRLSVWCSLEGLPFPELPQVVDHHRDDGDEQHNGNGRCPSRIVVRKPLNIELIGNHIGAVITAGHHAHNIKQFQAEDQDGGGHRDDGSLNIRDHDLEESLDFGGAIHPGGFQQFRWNAL